MRVGEPLRAALALGEAAWPASDAAARADLQSRFDSQRRAFEAQRFPSHAERIDRLDRLLALLDQHAEAMAAAISADFGHRSTHVTQLADGMVTRSAIRHARRHLRAWMRERRVPTAAAHWPGRSRVQSMPLGVVGIVSPWNYPCQLSLGPAAAALAAGNRVLVKPSETVPRFAAWLHGAVAERFAPDELAVATGDAGLARAFVALPFDHLLFTGSTAVGREVARAAAANLTPVTLELGGKSPAILNADLGSDHELAQAALRLMAGKLLNSGQTCIAPDHLLVHESLMGRLVPALRAATLRLYPTLADNPDYTAIVDKRHLARLNRLLDDAHAHGAQVLPLHTETATVQRKLPPFAIVGGDERMQVMREEVFGPLLPIRRFARIDEAIAQVNAGDRPLALYWFGRSRRDLRAVLENTVAGGVTVNDCLWHAAQETLPFGGVGASGHGRYHGVHGFRTFSHDRPVFLQSDHAGTGLIVPPYGRGFERTARWLRWIT